MKTVRVQYTVQASFADANAANIEKVMTALKADPVEGVAYMAFRGADGQTFTHVLIAASDEAQAKLTGLEAFKAFQAALKDSDPVSPPKPDTLTLVGASFDV